MAAVRPIMRARWSLRQQLRLFSFLVVLFIIGLGSFAAWKSRQLTQSNEQIIQNYKDLQQSLEDNFESTRLIGEIHTHLRLYMRAANAGSLKTIHQNTLLLQTKISSETKALLGDFLKMLAILEIRMASMQDNEEKIYETEKAIMRISGQLQQTTKRPMLDQLRELASQSCLTHHHLYNTSVLTGEPDNLERAKRDYIDLFQSIEKQIAQLKKELPASTHADLAALQDVYYTLEDSVSTISAIRAITMETQDKIDKLLTTIKEQVASEALQQTQESRLLVQAGLGTAQQNFQLMVLILLAIALLLIVLTVFIAHTVIRPLADFTLLLQRMRSVLTGLRCQNDFEGDLNYQTLLNSFTSKRQDEIGHVAAAVQELIGKLRELALFRQAVETDETPAEIYQRIARIFTDRLQLEDFLIYELDLKNPVMQVALRHITLAEDLVPEMLPGKECRAWRSGLTVSSLQDAFTCPGFPAGDRLRHICIPMQVGDQRIGIVQFLFSIGDSRPRVIPLWEAICEAQHYLAEAIPVLQAKRLAGELQAMATQDQLTGLYNRHYLESALRQIVAGLKRRARTMCVLMCDIDHFKAINDAHGHDAGDQVLVQMADILLHSARSSDLIIRMGGEEFLILLLDCECKSSTTRTMAERLRTEVQAHHFLHNGITIRTTISIGMAVFPAHPDQDFWEAVKSADTALYHAKHSGRNQVVDFETYISNF